MKAVWKYVLIERGLNIIKMPAGAQLLHVGMQGGRPCVWALVEATHEQQERFLWCFGTGWELTDAALAGKFIGTAQTDDSLVWHVFESHLLSDASPSTSGDQHG